MRNLITSILLVYSAMCLAQMHTEKVRIGLQVGSSTARRTIKSLNNETYPVLNEAINYATETNSRPVWALSMDYSYSDKISFGILMSRQQLSGDFSQYTFLPIGGNATIVEEVTFELKRRYVGAVTKYHWNTNTDNIELYTGLRVGYVQWKRKIETSDPNFNALDQKTAGRPAIGIVPLGLKFYILDGLGISSELAIAAPYFINIGAVYKW